MKQIWPAPERNKGPILEVLAGALASNAFIVEVAGGTGQHAEHFARSQPGWTWLATDVDPAHVASMSAWTTEADLPNLPAPRTLDVEERPWDVGSPDVVFCANMIHIAPWRCAQALVAGAAEVLAPDGLLIAYGPYRIGGEHTAPSNAAFDENLRARDPAWGVRDLEAVDGLARAAGLVLVERVAMPANNQSIIWRRGKVGRGATSGS